MQRLPDRNRQAGLHGRMDPGHGRQKVEQHAADLQSEDLLFEVRLDISFCLGSVFCCLHARQERSLRLLVGSPLLLQRRLCSLGLPVMKEIPSASASYKSLVNASKESDISNYVGPCEQNRLRSRIWTVNTSIHK